MSVEIDRWGYHVCVLACQAELGRLPMLPEAYAVACVCRLETYFGRAWKSPPHAPDIVRSYNMGANQCAQHKSLFHTVGQGPRPDLSGLATPSAVQGCCALVVDSNPTPTGPKWFYGPYKVYSSAVEGARAIARLLIRDNVIGNGGTATRLGTADSVSRQLYNCRYYRGQSVDPEEAITAHRAQVQGCASAIARAVGHASHGLDGASRGKTAELLSPEPLEPPFPVVGLLTIGSRGPLVSRLQRHLNSTRTTADERLVEDGVFGARTEHRLRDEQARLGEPVTGTITEKQVANY